MDKCKLKMRYLKLFEQFENDRKIISTEEVIKSCLDLLKPRIFYRELFEYDINSWFLIIFANKNLMMEESQLEELSEINGIEIKKIDSGVFERFVDEQDHNLEKTAKHDNEGFLFSRWWGYWYDDSYRLGIIDSIDYGAGYLGEECRDIYTGNKFLGIPGRPEMKDKLSLSNLEETCFEFIKSESLSDNFDPEWVNI
jgi:hypothetical protein